MGGICRLGGLLCQLGEQLVGGGRRFAMTGKFLNAVLQGTNLVMQASHFFAGRPNEQDMCKDQGSDHGRHGNCPLWNAPLWNAPLWNAIAAGIVIRRELFCVGIAIHLKAPLE